MKVIRFHGKTTSGHTVNAEVPEDAEITSTDEWMMAEWNHEGVTITRYFHLEHFVMYELGYGVEAEIDE